MRYKLIKPALVFLIVGFFVMGPIVSYGEAQVVSGPQTNGSINVQGKIGDTAVIKDDDQAGINKPSQVDGDGERVQMIVDTSSMNKGRLPQAGEIISIKIAILGIFLVMICIWLLAQRNIGKYLKNN